MTQLRRRAERSGRPFGLAFVSIAAAVFFFVVRPVDAIQRRMGIEKPEDGRSDEATLLEEIRDILKEQRA